MNGAGLAEYALIAALVLGVSTAAVLSTGVGVRDIFSNLAGDERTAGEPPEQGAQFRISLLSQTLPTAVVGQFWSFEFETLAVLQDPGTVLVDDLVWTLSGDAPAWMTFDQASGFVSGTPSEPGLYTFTIAAAFAGASAERTFTLNVASGDAGGRFPLSIARGGVFLERGAVYDEDATTTIVLGPAGQASASLEYVFSGPIAANGVILSSDRPLAIEAEIDGAFVPVGTVDTGFNAFSERTATRWRLTNTAGSPASVATARLSFNGLSPVAPSLEDAAGPVVVVEGNVFSRTFTARDLGPAPVWSITAGTLPVGLVFTSDGTLSGRPVQSGAFPIEISVLDERGVRSVPRGFLVDVGAETTVASVLPVSVVRGDNTVLEIADLYDADATTAVPLAASGTTARFDVTFDRPLSANGIDLVIPSAATVSLQAFVGGTWTNVGTFGSGQHVFSERTATQWRIQSSGTALDLRTARLTFGGAAARAPMLDVVSLTPPRALVGEPFTHLLVATDLVDEGMWTILSGGLPPGLVVSSDGTLAGTPTLAGVYTASISVVDSRGVRATPRTLTVEIGAPASASAMIPLTIVRSDNQAQERGLLLDRAIDTSSLYSGTQFFTYAFPEPATLDTVELAFTGTTQFRVDVLTAPGVWTPLGTFGQGTHTFAERTSEQWRLVNTTTASGSIITARFGHQATIPVTPSIDTQSTQPTLFPTTGQPFSHTLAALDLEGSPVWSVTAGSLPQGLTLASDGTIAGTPTQVGIFLPSVTVVDARGVRAFPRAMRIEVQSSSATAATVMPTAAANYDGNSSIAPATFYDGSIDTRMTTASSGSSGGAMLVFPEPIAADGIVLDLSSGTASLEADTGSGFVSIGTFGSGTHTFAERTAARWRIWAPSREIRTFRMTRGGVSPVAPAIDTTTTATTLVAPHGEAFSHSFAAVDLGASPVWSVSSGSLPQGLSVSAVGVLSGTPTQLGRFIVQVAVMDERGMTSVVRPVTIDVVGSAASASVASVLPQSLRDTVNGGSFEVGSLHDAIADTAVSTTTWAPTNGVILNYPEPVTADGVVLDLSGSTVTLHAEINSAWVLVGTYGTGSHTFPVRTASRWLATTNQAVTIRTLRLSRGGVSVVTPAIDTASTQPTLFATIGQAFSHTLVASDVVGAPVWSIAAGALPQGLALSSSGVISGTPTQNGVFTPSVTVVDSRGVRAVPRAMRIEVNAAQTAATVMPREATQVDGTGVFDAARLYDASTATVVTTSNFHPSTGAILVFPEPVTADGIVLDIASGSASLFAEIGGTWASVGSYGSGTHTFGARAATRWLLSVPANTIRTWRMTFGGQAPVAPHVDPATATSPVAVAEGTPFTRTLATVNAVGPVTWRLASGSLPRGLTLSNAGVIEGSPTQSGSFTANIVATDSRGIQTSPVAITFNATIGSSGILASAVMPTSIQNGQGTAMTDVVPLLYDASSASTAHLASSWPSNEVILAFDRPVTANGFLLDVSSGSVTLQVENAPGSNTWTNLGSFASGTHSFAERTSTRWRFTGSNQTLRTLRLTHDGSAPIAPRIEPTTTDPTLFVPVGQSFSHTFTGHDIGAGANWVVTTGTVPPGLTLSSAGILSGTPTQVGAFVFSVSVNDRGIRAVPAQVRVEVQSNATVATRLPLSAVDAQGSGQIDAVAPLYDANTATARVLAAWPSSELTFAFDQPVAADGVVLDVSANVTVWAETAPGNWLNLGQFGSGTHSFAQRTAMRWRVSGPGTSITLRTVRFTHGGAAPLAPHIDVATTDPILFGTQGQSFTHTFLAQNLGAGGGFVVTTGTLPPGLTLGGSGVLSGTPTQAGVYIFSVSAVDAQGVRAFPRQARVEIQAVDNVATRFPLSAVGATGVARVEGIAALYDESAATTVAIPQVHPDNLVLFAFDRPVAANGIVIDVTSGTVSVSAETIPGTWASIGTFGAGTHTFATRTAMRWQLTAAGSSQSLRTARLRFDGVAPVAPRVEPTTTDPVLFANQGQSFSHTFSGHDIGAGGNWIVAAGTLPPGLSLSGAGLLSGAPSQAGVYLFSVSVVDNRGVRAVPQQVRLEVQAAVSAADRLPVSAFGSNGTTPRADAIAALYDNASATTESLPNAFPSTAVMFVFDRAVTANGIVLDTSAAVTLQVETTPNTWQTIGTLGTGTHSFQARTGTRWQIVGSSNQTVRTARLTHNGVAPVVPSLVPASTDTTLFPSQGQSFTHTFQANDLAASSNWLVVSGSVPPGLVLSGSGVLSGTPTQAGVFVFEVSVTGPGNSRAVARPVRVEVQSATHAGNSVPSSATLFGGSAIERGIVYDANATTTTGLSMSEGARIVFPAQVAANGVVLETTTNVNVQALLGSTWTTVGTFGSGSHSFPVRTAREWRAFAASGSGTLATFRITFNGNAPVTPHVDTGSTQATLFPVRNSAFSHTLAALNVQGPASWTVASGSLPPGLSLSSAGLVSGVATTPGLYTPTVTVTDARGVRAVPVAMRFEVQATDTAATDLPTNIAYSNAAALERAAVYDADADTTTTFSSGVQLVYTFGRQIAANGFQFDGTGSVTLQALIGSTWETIGTYTSGVHTFPSRTATQWRLLTNGTVVLRTGRLLFGGTGQFAPLLQAPSPQAAVRDAPFGLQLSAQHTQGTQSWSVVSGSLPAGVTLSPTTGLVSGVPTQTGNFSASVTVVDPRGIRAVPRTLNISVAAP